MPETVIGSVLAAEDEYFYEHKGVNVRSIGRAVDANLESGTASQGGSTITQQVVKNSLVGDDQDLSRKIREAFLAVELEKQMSKDEILERYLNSVYFGGGAYGVQAASEYYFNKNVGDLNWAEGALLAALIRSPGRLRPVQEPGAGQGTARHRVRAAHRHRAPHPSRSGPVLAGAAADRAQRAAAAQRLLRRRGQAAAARRGRVRPGGHARSPEQDGVRGRDPGVHHLRPRPPGESHRRPATRPCRTTRATAPST